MRKKPYTARGISRKKCIRCGKQASFQWQICSMGNLYTPVCSSCDIALNGAVLKFMKIPQRSQIMKAYKEKH